MDMAAVMDEVYLALTAATGLGGLYVAGTQENTLIAILSLGLLMAAWKLRKAKQHIAELEGGEQEPASD